MAVGYTMDTLYFETLPLAIIISYDVVLADLVIIETIVHDCSLNYTTG